MQIDKYHLQPVYQRYFLRYMINRLESKIYQIMAHPNVAKYTSRLLRDSLDPYIEDPLMAFEKIAEHVVGEDPKQVQFYGDQLYVPSMKSARLDVFELGKPDKVNEISLPGMPVEVLIDTQRKYCFVSEMGKGEDGKNSVIGMNLTKPDKIKFRTVTKGKWPKFMATRPNSEELWVSNWLSDNTSVIDISKGETVDIFPTGKTPRGIAFTPDGKYAYICGYYSRDVMKVDGNTHEILAKIKMPFPLWSYQGTPRHIVIDEKGSFAYVSNMGRGTVHKIDLKTDQIESTSYVGDRTATIELFPDQKHLVAVNHGETFMTIVNTHNLKVIGTIPTNGHAFGADIHHSGKYIAAVSFDTRMLEIFKSK